MTFLTIFFDNFPELYIKKISEKVLGTSMIVASLELGWVPDENFSALKFSCNMVCTCLFVFFKFILCFDWIISTKISTKVSTKFAGPN